MKSQFRWAVKQNHIGYIRLPRHNERLKASIDSGEHCCFTISGTTLNQNESLQIKSSQMLVFR